MGGVRRIRFSPDGKQLALSGIGKITNVDGFVGPCRMEVWDWRTGKRTAELQDNHQAVLNDVLWSADGKRLTAAGGGDGGGLLVVWDVAAKTPEAKIKLKGHVHRLVAVGGTLLTASGFEGMQVWDTAVWAGGAKASAATSGGVSVERIVEKVNV